MSCFEVRSDFGALWRGEVEPVRRRELLDHLAGCARCDHAFRIFALTAPVLHREAELPAEQPGEAAAGGVEGLAAASRRYGGMPARRAASVSRAGGARRQWAQACAALTMVVAAGFAAYLSAVVPTQSLDDALGGYESTAGLDQQAPVIFNDLAG